MMMNKNQRRRPKVEMPDFTPDEQAKINREAVINGVNTLRRAMIDEHR